MLFIGNFSLQITLYTHKLMERTKYQKKINEKKHNTKQKLQNKVYP